MTGFGRAVEWSRAVLATLAAARISIGLVALGCAVLSLEQGLDVVRALVEDANLYIRADGMRGAGWWIVLFQWSAFVGACVWSGLNAWYWPRVLHRLFLGATPPGWFKLFVRGLGLAPSGAASVAVLKVANSPGAGGIRDVWMGLTACVAVMLALAVFFARRETLFRAFGRWYNRPSRILDPESRAAADGREARLTRGDDAFFLASAAVGVSLVAALCVPGLRTVVAQTLGSAALAFAAIGVLISMLSFLAWAFGRVRLPVFTSLVLAFAVFSCTNDNHGVRVIEGAGPPPAAPALGVALARWEVANPDPSAPIVLVAAAGGASRAGYWTGAVLRALDGRTSGLFGSRVFAISAVSGGSLGAVGYAARLAETGGAGTGGCYDPAAADRFDQAFLGGDYLAPAVAGLLYPDLLQRFLPIPLFPDRAVALEEGWERGWRRAVADPVVAASGCAPRVSSDRMAGDYRSIWAASLSGRGRWVPLVLVNGTLVEDGKRVITAPVSIDPGVFEDAHDFYDLAERPVRASTAILNGARFPVVSPAGTILGPRHPRGRIVDGGYFENGGLETLLDLARYLQVAAPRRRVLIVEIGNDLPEDSERFPADLQRYANGADAGQILRRRLAVQPAPESGAPMLSEVSSIVGGLYGTRTSRGILAAKRLSGLDANGLGALFSRVTFDLPRLGAGATMSWSLSRDSRGLIDGLLAVDRPVTRATPDGPLVLCQRAAADQVAALVGGRAAPAASACRPEWAVAGAVGYPLRGGWVGPPTADDAARAHAVPAGQSIPPPAAQAPDGRRRR